MDCWAPNSGPGALLQAKRHEASSALVANSIWDVSEEMGVSTVDIGNDRH